MQSGRIAHLRRWAAAPPAGWLLAVATVVALFYKLPHTLAGGRLYAEEGTIFLAALDGRSIGSAAFYIYKGSLQLPTNLAVWLATRAPVEALPLVTTWISVAMLAGVAAQLAGWARAHGVGRLAALLAAIAFPLSSATDEVLATATNLQWVCSVSALLVLATPPEALRHRLGPRTAWLLVCGLTGVPSCFLAPFLLLRGVLERSRPHLILGGTLAAATLLQAWLVLTHDVGDRAFAVQPLMVAAATVQHMIILPFTGRQAAIMLHHLVFPTGFDALRALAVLLPGLAVAAVGLWWARRSGARWPCLLLTAGGVAAATAVNCFGALGRPEWLLDPTHDARYFILSYTLLLLVAALITRIGGTAGRVALLVLAWPALLGALVYSPLRASAIDRGPSWQRQIDACRRTGRTLCDVAIWPAPPAGEPYSWTVRVRL